MSALFLKLIALITMLVDHTAACMNRAGLLAAGNPYGLIVYEGNFSLYWLMRVIGRLAFPIFCFQIVEGAMHTRNKGYYAVRIGLLAVISEVPFDFALHAAVPYWGGQNVFITLLLGLLLVYELQWADSQSGKVRIIGYIAYPVLVAGVGVVCRELLKNDYNMAGILMIATFGLLSLERVQRLEWRLASRIVRIVVVAVGMMLCVAFTNDFESWCFFSLIPIALYNGQKGYESKVFQYGAYLFYPVHLTILGLIFVLPKMLP